MVSYYMQRKKQPMECIFCHKSFDRDEYDVGRKICSLSCKFWHGIQDENQSCWIWRFKKNRLGYGVIRWKGHEYIAHRIGFSEFHRLEDHPTKMLFNICGNKACVRGDHWTLDSMYKFRKESSDPTA